MKPATNTWCLGLLEFQLNSICALRNRRDDRRFNSVGHSTVQFNRFEEEATWSIGLRMRQVFHSSSAIGNFSPKNPWGPKHAAVPGRPLNRPDFELLTKNSWGQAFRGNSRKLQGGGKDAHRRNKFGAKKERKVADNCNVFCCLIHKILSDWKKMLDWCSSKKHSELIYLMWFLVPQHLIVFCTKMLLACRGEEEKLKKWFLLPLDASCCFVTFGEVEHT